MEDETTLDRIYDVQRMQLVEQMRIYDVLLALLGNADKELAKRVAEMHEKFQYIGPLPFNETGE